MSEERFEEFLRNAARGYNRPPETPREEMWGRIVAARSERRRPQGLLRWGLAAAAVLALGIAIGRYTVVDRAPASLAAESEAESGTAYRVAALEHMQRVETFLTVFRAEATARPMESAPRTARELLVGTRLLMTSPAAQDQQVATLLEDIELVLAQIALYSGSDGSDELDLIDQGIQQRGVLLRLRAIAPTDLSAARGEL
ncbi:MAG TPA: hypothetical protein VNL18_13885 [Gemmatimonadales bacterium]|nr:hypothetical protein [Gemmatimonadales bacterium]